MDYSAKRGRNTLPEFQKYLLDKKLVPEAKVSNAPQSPLDALYSDK